MGGSYLTLKLIKIVIDLKLVTNIKVINMESNGNSNIEDDWENNTELDKENDLNSKLTLLNVNAAEFVPSFVIPTSGQESQEKPEANGDVTPDNPALAEPPPAVAPQKVEEPPDKSPVDSWEGLGDSGGTTPEGDDDDTSQSDKITKKNKKKTVAVERDDSIKKEHINVIFIGHVDAGKSTIGGQI